MKIGLISDTHNNIENLQKALAIIKDVQIDLLVHCGDVTSIETVQWLSEYPIILTFGNGDFINGEIKSTLIGFNAENIADYSFQGIIGGKQIGVTHGHIPELLNKMVQSQALDYIFTGHSHRRRDEYIGKTRIINPGSLGGMFYQSRSIAILDLETDKLIVEVIR
jgi:hypothetical protein